jgi:hypothetical protein
MKLYILKAPPNKLSPRYSVVTYDNVTNKITYVVRPKLFEIPPDHEIFQTNPNFVQQIPENCLEYNGVTYLPGHVQTIDLNELKNSYKWADQSTYAITYDLQLTNYSDIFHVESTTLDKRVSFKEYLQSQNQYLSMMMFVPYASGDDMCIFTSVSDHPDAALITNGDIEVVEITESSPVAYLKTLLFPRISVTSPSVIRKDTSETITIQLKENLTGNDISNRSSTIYVDPIIGTVNKSRVQLINGTGSFVISAAGLNVGDVIRVKLGWKYWPGASDVFITVVE